MAGLLYSFGCGVSSQSNIFIVFLIMSSLADLESAVMTKYLVSPALVNLLINRTLTILFFSLSSFNIASFGL